MNYKAYHKFVNYFWNEERDGFKSWGGYNRFFNPCIPGKEGDKLIESLASLCHGNYEAAKKAISILKSKGIKNVCNKDGSTTPIEWAPTEEASVAIKIINNYVSSWPRDSKKQNHKIDGILDKIFRRSIRFSVPNPLWWIPAGFIYPYRKIKSIFRKHFPSPPVRQFCKGCAKDITPSLWGFCSIECMAKTID